MEKFNITFCGETLPEHDLATVKRRFARVFHIDSTARVEACFSGQRIILRRKLGKEEAAALIASLRRLGVVIHIEKIESEEVVPQSEPQSEEAAPPRRRRRQPGAPNIFDLHLSERAGMDTEEQKQGSSRAFSN